MDPNFILSEWKYYYRTQIGLFHFFPLCNGLSTMVKRLSHFILHFLNESAKLSNRRFGCWCLIENFDNFLVFQRKKFEKKFLVRKNSKENSAKFWKFSIFEFYFKIFHHSNRLILESFSGSCRRKSFIRNSGEQKSRKNWIRTETERNRALWPFF